MLKNRIHATLIACAKPCPVADLFGASPQQYLSKLGADHRYAPLLTTR